MKKQYYKPELFLFDIELENTITTSNIGVITRNDEDIDLATNPWDDLFE